MSIACEALAVSLFNAKQLWFVVATDNHIGYMEKDPVRHNDSLEAFEEVLKIAKSQNVSDVTECV